MERRFEQVDVFGARPYAGNPLAVVVDGEGITDAQMQELARWTNLSETAFLLPPTTPEADYRLRIFTLASELSFAGHPTLGSCHAWLRAGGQPQQGREIVQQGAAGLVRLRRSEGMLAFAAPPLIGSGPLEEEHVAALCRVLRIERRDVVAAQRVDNGPGWVGLLLRDPAAVLAVEPPPARDPALGQFDVGLVALYPAGAECAIEVRALFSDERGLVREDPVTGSLNASLAQWLLASGRLTAPYVASQGTRLGRVGRPRIEQDSDGTVWVGGTTFTCISGRIEL